MKRPWKIEASLAFAVIVIALAAGALGASIVAHGDKSNTSEKDCMQFVSDSTIPDGTVEHNGVDVTKIWAVKNCGDTTWNNDKLVQVYGEGQQPNLSNIADKSYSVPPLKAGESGEISIKIHVPQDPGRYGVWFELESPDKIHRFGDPLWVIIQVQ